MCPNIMAFTLIFFDDNSTAAHFARLFKADFEDEYKLIPLFPFSDETEEIVVTESTDLR